MSTFHSRLGATPADLDTPALLVDLDLLDRNIARIADTCRRAGVQWRPHCKPHKSGELARLLVERGAVGVACAKLSEAAAMADAGVRDILVANQIVGATKIAALMDLRRKADVAVCVDDMENARALDEAAHAAGLRLRVLIEVDTGTRRAGVQAGEPVLDLARRIRKLPRLELAGVMTWEGHTTQIWPADAKAAAIRLAVGALVASAELCRARGIPMPIVSCGGTGTYETSAFLPGVTEIQAGGGIFGDVRYRHAYHVELDYALTVMTTVTSRPTPRRIVIDAGKKALSTDAAMPEPLGLPPIEALGFSAEHGKIELACDAVEPRIGDRIALVPGYADTTVHLHRCLYGVRGGRIAAVWPLRDDARLL